MTTPPTKQKTTDKPPVKLPTFEMNEEGRCLIGVDDEHQAAALFGGKTKEFGSAMLSHCVNVSGRAEANAYDKAYAVAIVNEVAPRDGIEGMLATQMAAVHIATMRHSRLMAGCDTIPQLELQERVLNKLTRTFTTQMEALRKYRNGGKQTVTVQHVNVEDGGQAIVGDVSHGGGSKDER